MSTDPTFLPFVGRDYFESQPRVLVLGESHWGEPEHAVPTITQEFVHRAVFAGRHAFTTKVAKLVGLLPPTEAITTDMLQSVWNRLAFYNYVQRLVATAPRTPPVPSDWVISHDAFLTVVDQLHPQVVVSLGWQLWNGLVSVLGEETHSLPVPHLRLSRPFGSVMIVPIAHPSGRGFRYGQWLSRLAQCLTLNETGEH